MPTKEELQDRLNAAYEDVDRLLQQQKDDKAEREGMLKDIDDLTAERDQLQDNYDAQVRTARGLLDSYRLERKRGEQLEQKLTYVRTQAEAYLAFILVLKQSLGDQGKT